jgi:hypothetical protein
MASSADMLPRGATRASAKPYCPMSIMYWPRDTSVP